MVRAAVNLVSNMMLSSILVLDAIALLVRPVHECGEWGISRAVIPFSVACVGKRAVLRSRMHV